MTPGESFRMIYGFCLMLAVVVLAVLVALGRVEEKTSFGLGVLFMILKDMGADFGKWAFSIKSEPEKEKTE